MKKVKLILVMAFCMIMSITLQAQDKPNDYFVGNWNVLVEGTPNGDSHMPFKLTRVDGKLQGGLVDAKGAINTPFTKIDEKGDNITLFFTGGGYNLYITLDKKDGNKATGSLKDMFDATATRVVEAKDTTTSK